MDGKNNGFNSMLQDKFSAVVVSDGIMDTIKANSVEDLNNEINKVRAVSISFAVVSRS